jgi:hypothetical protein
LTRIFLLHTKRYNAAQMLDDLRALVMIEELLEARDRRLLIREQRRFLRAEMARRFVLLAVALILVALAAMGVATPR